MSENKVNLVFAKKINHYLKESGKTQIALAEHMGVSGATVSNWCKGIKAPRMNKLDKLCDFFNITPSDLMESEKEITGVDNPDIRMIARAGKKMTNEQAENLRKYAEFMFPEAFNDQ